MSEGSGGAASRTAPADGDRSDLRREIRATLMPGFVGFDAPEWLLEALGDGLVASCVYGANVRDREQLARLGAALRTAGPDSLIAIDEEGGEVTRLHYLEGAPYPGGAVLGRIDDPDYTEEIGRRVGRDILASGFNLALAPDADVNSNAANPVIGTRSFGADPVLASRHVEAWVRGLEGTGAVSCPKHFPGHGDTAQDSHLALPVVDAPVEVIERRDLPPFRAAIAAGARTIMTSHILLPQLDPTGPATFSRAILHGLLRERLGFDGVIVSDALDMAGASGDIGVPEAAVRALAAGCDLLCLGTGTDGDRLHGIELHVLDAVREGRLDEARVREAASRVRALAGGAASGVASPAASAPGTAAGTADALDAPDAAIVAPVSLARELERIAASFDGAETARAWFADHPSAWVLRIDAEANMAVGHAPWGPFAAAAHPLPGGEPAASAFARRPLIPIDDASTPLWPLEELTEQGAVVIGRDIHRRSFARECVDGLRAAGVPVLCVEAGWPGPKTGYADLACFGSSRLVGSALLALMEGGTP